MKKYVLVLLISFTHFVLPAQHSVKDLSEYMKSIRKKPQTPVPISIFADKKNSLKMFRLLEPYFDDTLAVVRGKALYLAKQMGSRSTDEVLRHAVVHHLVLALNDRNAGVCGNVIQALSKFSRLDFGKVELDSILNHIRVGVPHLDKIMKLAAYLQINGSVRKINTAIESTKSAQLKWAGLVSLARLSDRSAINRIVNRLSKASINDDFIYEVIPDLVFTRQREILVFIETIIKSDSKDCTSSNPDSNEKIKCGYRAIEMIAPAIEEFPYSVDESGSLNTDNYEEALAKIRDWLNAHSDYIIRDDEY
jgi:hypothetical protein